MNRRQRTIVAVCAAAFLAFLDTTIVNVSFPDIEASFTESTRSQLSWVLDAYFIVIAAFLVPAGMLADRIGRRRVFLGSVVLFVVASVLCALAPTWPLLVAARVAQGLAAAAVAPTSMALMLAEFPAERRSQGVAIWGAAAALAAASGPPLGGLLVELGDWRWIFLANVPVGAVILVLGMGAIRESKDEQATGMPDIAGALMAAVGLGALTLAITEWNAWGGTSLRVIGLLVLTGVLMAWTTRRCLVHPVPVVEPRLMRIRSFRDGNVATLLFSVAFFSMILGNILFLTSIWGYSTLEAGLAVGPGPLASTLVAVPAGRLADRFGHRVVIVPGTLLYALGLWMLSEAGATPAYVEAWLPGQVVIGIGIGLAFPTLGAASVRDIPDSDFGSASAVGSAFRQFGAVIGTAVVIAIIGSPTSLQDAFDASGRAYAFGITAGLLAGLVSLLLQPRRALLLSEAST